MKHRRNRSFIFNCCFNRLTNRKLNDDHRSRLKKKWRSANKNLKLRPVVAIDRHVSGWIRFDFVLNFSWFFVFFFGGGGVERAATTLWQLSPGRTRSNGGAETPTGPLTPAPRHRSHLFFVCWPVFAFGFSCVFGLFCCFLYFFLGHINQTEKKCLPECVCVWNYVSSRSCLASARWHYCRNIGNQNFPPRCEELWVCVCVCVCVLGCIGDRVLFLSTSRRLFFGDHAALVDRPVDNDGPIGRGRAVDAAHLRTRLSRK